MGVLDGLKPKEVFHFFEELTRIPHGSGNVRAISDYLTDFARSRGYEIVQDAACNVLVALPASPGREDLAPLTLQGHIDMVAVRDEGAEVDPARDALQLRVDGDLLYAEGTSLGGDDGIAIAYFCALMDDPSIEHPALYLLMTADEETGMDGARALAPDLLKTTHFVNIDSEEEGVLLAGCAGGGRAHLALPVALVGMTGTRTDIRVIGLRGGHSGQEIHKGRGNANILAGRLLQALSDAGVRFAVEELAGGVADNAIPASAHIGLLLPAGDAGNTERVVAALREAEAAICAELSAKDPDFALEMTFSGEVVETSCLSAEAAESAAALLLVVPDGVQAMSADMPGLVETSLNLGVMRLERADRGSSLLHLDFAVRSSRETARDLLIRRLELLAARFGATCSTHGLYPGWTYDPASVVCRHFADVYAALYGKEARVAAIHAGVECGLFKEKRADLDCLSIGPDLAHVHSTAERLHIASAGRTWDYLKEALKRWEIKE